MLVGGGVGGGGVGEWSGCCWCAVRDRILWYVVRSCDVMAVRIRNAMVRTA